MRAKSSVRLTTASGSTDGVWLTTKVEHDHHIYIDGKRLVIGCNAPLNYKKLYAAIAKKRSARLKELEASDYSEAEIEGMMDLWDTDHKLVETSAAFCVGIDLTKNVAVAQFRNADGSLVHKIIKPEVLEKHLATFIAHLAEDCK